MPLRVGTEPILKAYNLHQGYVGYNSVFGSQPNRPEYPILDSLAFWVDAQNGNFTDTVGGQTGSVSGTVNIIDQNYFSGFSTSSYLEYNTDTFNSPRGNSFSIETWGYYPTSFADLNLETLIGFERPPNTDSMTYTNDFIFSADSGSTGNFIYTLLSYTFGSSVDSKLEFGTSVPLTGSWVHVVTVCELNESSQTTAKVYATPKDGTTVINTGVIQNVGNLFSDFGNYMRVGMCPAGSTGFATAFNNGYVGLVRIYNKSLSEAEVMYNYLQSEYRF